MPRGWYQARGERHANRDARLPTAAPAATATPTRRARGTSSAIAAEPTATAATPAAATPATAAAGRTPLASDVHRDRPAVEGRSVERLDGALGLLIRSVLHKAETTRLPCRSIDDHAGRGHFTELGEGLLQLLVHRRVRQVAHIQPVSHYYFISIAWHRIRSRIRMWSRCRKPHPKCPHALEAASAQNTISNRRKPPTDTPLPLAGMSTLPRPGKSGHRWRGDAPWPEMPAVGTSFRIFSNRRGALTWRTQGPCLTPETSRRAACRATRLRAGASRSARPSPTRPARSPRTSRRRAAGRAPRSPA
jgi:hypothetical protein